MVVIRIQNLVIWVLISEIPANAPFDVFSKAGV